MRIGAHGWMVEKNREMRSLTISGGGKTPGSVNDKGDKPEGEAEGTNELDGFGCEKSNEDKSGCDNDEN